MCGGDDHHARIAAGLSEAVTTSVFDRVADMLGETETRRCANNRH